MTASNEIPPSPAPEDSSPSTRLVEVGRRFAQRIDTVNMPVYRGSSVLFDSLAETEAAGKAVGVGQRHASTYATVGTPTTFALMDAIADIEGGGVACRAALMPSGLAAITTALLAFLAPGDHLLVSDSVYGPMRVFCEGMLARIGVETEYFDPAAGDEIAERVRPRTRVIYLESPGSYTFEIQDVPAICAMARARGIVTMIDNAWGSPTFARPFDWGVDLSILPLTKYWSGHADVLMGAVVIRESLWPKLWATVRQLGLCVGGDDAFLVLRGLRTAEVRMQRHQQSALLVAQWLATRPEVARVLHPALPTHPQHTRWQRDFKGSSGLFSIELRGPTDAGAQRAALVALCEKRRHFHIGYSWGGFESLIMPARLNGLRHVAPWAGGPLIRLHIGLEDPEDLIADLETGFAAMATALG